MTSLAILLTGFSIFSALVLALTHFRKAHYAERPLSKMMGLLLLVALGGLQMAHFVWLSLDLAWVATVAYRMQLFAVAPAFFLFSGPLLRPQQATSLRPAMFWHALPMLLSPLLPADFALPLAFVIGAGYLLWLARCIYQLRRERAGFQREIVLLGAVFAIAVGVAGLGLVQAQLPDKLFFTLYAMSIGLAFLLVQITLGIRPQLSTEVSEAVEAAEMAEAAYVSSTLVNVDCEAALGRLHELMQGRRVYMDAELSLPGLAEQLALSGHQLSELINSRLGKGFSRYLREQRVAAAKAMLRAEPSASVLSVGLGVGFSSQSNFYEAFREIEGMTPGQYRKLKGKVGSPG